MTLREGAPELLRRVPPLFFWEMGDYGHLAHIRLDEVEGALAVFADGAEHMLAQVRHAGQVGVFVHDLFHANGYLVGEVHHGRKAKLLG